MRFEPFKHAFEALVEAVVNPSEDPDKVRAAIRNVFGKVEPQLIRQERAFLQARSSDPQALSTIYRQVRSRQIMGVARRLLLEHRSSNRSWLYLNRQAAFVGALSICEEEGDSPLGPINLTIISDHLEELIDWLTT